MVNSSDFIKRLEKVIHYYGLSASAFAEKIGVQRSSISHILSGRNKPSLEFVLKILSSFPEVDLYWLLNGKGSFPNDQDSGFKSDGLKKDPGDLNISDPPNVKSNSKKSIERIIIFYSDGTFDSFEK